MVAFILILLLIAVFCIYMAIVVSKKRKASFAKFIGDNAITVTKKSEPFRDGKIVIYDERTNLLWIYQSFMKNQLSFQSQKITGCELIVDDVTNFKTSISSSAGRALVGGVLLGGVGAVIGGVTGKKKGSQLVKNIDLIISTSDLSNPYIKISVLRDKKGIPKEGFTFRTQYEASMYWCKFIEALTKQTTIADEQ